VTNLPNIPEPALEIARDLFDLLEKHTSDGVGITRASYGMGEQFAHDAVTRIAEAEGLEVATDVAGNLYITLPGQDRSGKASIIGSHLDSVPSGGNFDGAAGVLAGLATIVGWKRGGFSGKDDVTVMAIRAEESPWFPYSYIGSKAAFGILPADALDIERSDNGRSLADHIAELGFDPDAVRRGEAYLDPSRLKCYIELHIEQGPVLIEQKFPVAAVSGIRGSFRYRAARVLGEYAHSGAVPRAYRHDAVAAGAELVSRLNADWRSLEAEGKDLTVTFGIFGTNPTVHAFSKVAGEVDFCIDVRSHDVAVLAHMQKRVLHHVAAIESEFGVQFELGKLTDSQPAPMSKEVLSVIEKGTGEIGIPFVEMACGAGHDAAVFAQQGVPTAMLLIRNEGGSHNPDEQMEFDDFAVGTRLMARALAHIA
jgi:N-carbamoyl-L-amino-acid hydrolase